MIWVLIIIAIASVYSAMQIANIRAEQVFQSKQQAKRQAARDRAAADKVYSDMGIRRDSDGCWI